MSAVVEEYNDTGRSHRGVITPDDIEYFCCAAADAVMDVYDDADKVAMKDKICQVESRKKWQSNAHRPTTVFVVAYVGPLRRRRLSLSVTQMMRMKLGNYYVHVIVSLEPFHNRSIRAYLREEGGCHWAEQRLRDCSRHEAAYQSLCCLCPMAGSLSRCLKRHRVQNASAVPRNQRRGVVPKPTCFEQRHRAFSEQRVRRVLTDPAGM